MPKHFEYMHEYLTDTARGDTSQHLEYHAQELLNAHAKEGWKFKTCRRITLDGECKFELLIIMERKTFNR